MYVWEFGKAMNEKMNGTAGEEKSSFLLYCEIIEHPKPEFLGFGTGLSTS